MSISELMEMWDDEEEVPISSDFELSSSENQRRDNYLKEFSQEPEKRVSQVSSSRSYFRNKIRDLYCDSEQNEDGAELLKEYYEVIVQMMEFHNENPEVGEVFLKALFVNSAQSDVYKQLGELAIVSMSDEERELFSCCFDLLHKLSDNLMRRGITLQPILEQEEGQLVDFESDIGLLMHLPKFNIPTNLPSDVNSDFLRHSSPVLRLISAAQLNAPFQDWVRLVRDKSELVKVEAFSHPRLPRSQKLKFLKKHFCRPDIFRKLINPEIFQSLRGKDLAFFAEQFLAKGIGSRSKMPSTEKEWLESIYFSESILIVEDIAKHRRATISTLDKIAQVCLKNKDFGLKESESQVRILQSIVDHSFVDLSTLGRIWFSKFRERLDFPEDLVEELNKGFVAKVRNLFRRRIDLEA